MSSANAPKTPPPDRVKVISLIKHLPTQPTTHIEHDAPPEIKPPAPPHLQKLNKLVVDAYKVVGFGILTVIVFGLISYLTVSLFYLVSRSWIVPTVLSPTDDKVLELRTRLTEQTAQRDKLLADQRDSERIISAQEEFQAAFRNALAADLKDRQTELSRLRALAHHYSSARGQIEKSNQAFSGYSRDRIQKEFDAHLIDRDAMLSGSYQLAQIANANLSLAEKETEIGTRTSELARQAQSLDSALRRGNQQLSYEVLKMTEDYQHSMLESAKARDNRDVTAKTVGRYNQMIELLSNSPYVRASEHRANLAFVPYDNLDDLVPGTPVYGCSLAMVVCQKVGTVVSVIPGEILGHHPHRNEELRGRNIEIELSDPRWAESRVLFARGKPLGF